MIRTGAPNHPSGSCGRNDSARFFYNAHTSTRGARLDIKEKWDLALKQDPNPMRILPSFLLPLGGVPGLGGLLGRAPPGLAVAVPADRLGQAGGEVGALRLPAELAAELGRVDRVAAVVAGAVAHPVEVVLVPAEAFEDLAQHGDVVQLAVGADQVGLADAAASEDGPHR